MSKTRENSLSSHEPVIIDGLNNYETAAAGKDAGSSTALALHQLMLFDAGRYFIMVGLLGAELRDEFLPEFKSLARSFKRQSETERAPTQR